MFLSVIEVFKLGIGPSVVAHDGADDGGRRRPAVAAASLVLRGDGSHFMPLDNCIAAMRQTGEEMSAKFKETSLGGLAVNLPEC